MKKQIKPEHYKRLVKMNDKMQAIGDFVRSVTDQGQAMIAEARAETKAIWAEIAENDPSLDIPNTDWAPTMETNTIQAMMKRYAT